MYRILILFFFIMFISCLLNAQTFVTLNQTKSKSDLIINSEKKISFNNSIKGFYLYNHKAENIKYTKLNIPGYFPNNDIGNPELPVMAKLIEMPYNAIPEIKILAYEKEIVKLNDYGFIKPIYPNQESLFKNQDPSTKDFKKNKEIYQNYSYYEAEPVTINYKGIMRGVNIAQIIINPFEYDIKSNSLIIKNNMQVEITFKNADLLKTQTMKANKYSPAFKSAYKKLWNYKSPLNKTVISNQPIKYVIISDRMFEEVLQEFIEWKTKKGFNVIETYTDEIGYTKEEIKNYLQNLYDAGTINDPAPTYALFVGDIEQIPSFQTNIPNISSHVTDMYYCEFDGNGDYIPDMYFGRFSAQNVEQLIPQIEKTIMYEKFLFPNPEFIVESVLVSGMDSNFGYTHGNGQINYATNYYFNQNIGVIDHTYLYPESGSLSSEIIQNISDGVGFVNYTAHCHSNGWANPNFTVSDVAGLENENMYFFIISNCCQPNRFNINECFGEALLRADKKGAVVHIGATNNTMWNEDFYWSVGVTNKIQEHPIYEETTNAAYDHLFHFNDEVPYTTAYQIIFIGNMAVMQSTSTRDKYYWEVYHVLGDPSVKPYIGETNQVYAEHLPLTYIGANNFLVNTEPDAYVAISIDGKLLDAKSANANGEALLEFDILTSEATADIVVTKQFKSPYFGNVIISPNDNDYDVMMKSIIDPQPIIHVNEANITPIFEIINIGQITLESVNVGYILNQDEPVEIFWEGSLETLDSEIITFPEINLEDGNHSFVAYVDKPNGQTDEYPENNQINRSIKVYSGNVKIVKALEPNPIICNDYEFTPQIIIKNIDNYPLTNLICGYKTNEINYEFVWEGYLEGSQTDTISFPVNQFMDGKNVIEYFISGPNDGSNLNTNNIKKARDFRMIHNGYEIQLDLFTDLYGDENTWELIDYYSEETLYYGGPYPSYTQENYIYNWCLTSGCYTFTIYDSYGDGMNGNNPGQIIITNLISGEIILNLMGNDESFTDEYSITFCLKDIMCPNDTIINIINNEPFLLQGGLPEGGIYSGVGVEDGFFNPSDLEDGEYLITYSYKLPESEEVLTCSFTITILVTNDLTNKKYKITQFYPNPTKGIIYLNNQNLINLEIINMSGQIVKKINNLNEKSIIDISNFSAGTYIIKITDIISNQIIYRKINLNK